MTWGGGWNRGKVFKIPNFDVVMTPTMSRNIFKVIWKFWKNSNFWVILESLLQLKRNFDNFDHFKSWNYPFLCVWWVTKEFELIKIPEVCFPVCKPTKKYLMSYRVNLNKIPSLSRELNYWLMIDWVNLNYRLLYFLLLY